jgi:hypothetical protein
VAAPRLFVSSTYYDLRFVRADLAILEEQMGVEVVRFEAGQIPYHTAPTLSEAICKEIDNCNILVSVIGGRYGSVIANDDRELSISQLEVERAVKSGLLLFAFIDADVLSQYSVFLANRLSATSIRWPAVDDVRVFDFIKYIHDLPGRNPVFPFRTPREIQDILKIQLAGLFCDLLQRVKQGHFASHLDQVISSAERLQTLQTDLAQREAQVDQRMREMVLPDHDIYATVQRVLGLAYRTFFRNKVELVTLLRAHLFDEILENQLPERMRDRIYFKRESPKLYLALTKECFAADGEIRVADITSGSDVVWSGTRMPTGNITAVTVSTAERHS